MQPSIEDIVLGALPWIPKVHFHNPFLALENGDDFLRHFHLVAKGAGGFPVNWGRSGNATDRGGSAPQRENRRVLPGAHQRETLTAKRAGTGTACSAMERAGKDGLNLPW